MAERASVLSGSSHNTPYCLVRHARRSGDAAQGKATRRCIAHLVTNTRPRLVDFPLRGGYVLLGARHASYYMTVLRRCQGASAEGAQDA